MLPTAGDPRGGAVQMQWQQPGYDGVPAGRGYNRLPVRTVQPPAGEDDLPKAKCCAPTLYAPPDGGRTRFSNSSALVLSSTASTDSERGWVGRWELNDAETNALLFRIETGGGRSKADGMLSEDEILAFISKEQNQHLVMCLPVAIHGLLNEKFVRQAVNEFDYDGNHMVDEREWRAFVGRVQNMHIQFLMQKGFGSFRVFWGRGQRWGILVADTMEGGSQEILLEAAEALLTGGPTRIATNGYPVLSGDAAQVSGIIEAAKARTFQCGRDPEADCCCLLPPGWCSDLYYYSANIHPLHGIFACDPNNRLSNMERLGMELATIGFSLCTSSFKQTWVIDEDPPIWFLKYSPVFSLLVVTLPGYAIWYSLFFLFTCPCCLVDRAVALEAKVRRSDMCTRIGGFLGWCLLLALVVLLLGAIAYNMLTIPGILHSSGKGPHQIVLTIWKNLHFNTVVIARIQGYLIAWGLMIFVYFNPLIAWGQPDPYGKAVLGDYIGLGQWRIEKQRFQIASLLAATHRSMPVFEDAAPIDGACDRCWSPQRAPIARGPGEKAAGSVCCVQS
jgi:hypothetical protein